MTRRLFFAVLAGAAVQRRDLYRMTRAVIMALHGATRGPDGVYYVHTSRAVWDKMQGRDVALMSTCRATSLS